MAGFLVFIPERISRERHVIAPVDLLGAVGLQDLAEGFDVIQSVGPDDRSGHLFAWRSPRTELSRRLEYTPAAQTWIAAVGAGDDRRRYWVGIWNAEPPGPEDLLRPVLLEGEHVELGDGLTWRFPVGIQLPAELQLAADGTWRHKTIERFTRFEDDCQRWNARYLETEGRGLPIGEITSFLVDALRLHYRLTPEVASHLGLFRTDRLRDPFLAVLGIRTLAERMGVEA